MATLTATDTWAAFLIEYAAASDGDTIQFEKSGGGALTLTMTANFTSEKDLIYELESGTTSLTINMGIYTFTFAGQASGTTDTQNWNALTTFNRESNNQIVLGVRVTNGPLTLNIYNSTITNSGDDDGLSVSGGSNALTVNCYRCTGTANGNDGFKIQHTSGTVIPILNLYLCTGIGNADDGASPHEDSILNIYGGTFNEIKTGGTTTAIVNAWNADIIGGDDGIHPDSVSISAADESVFNLTFCRISQSATMTSDVIVSTGGTVNLNDCSVVNNGTRETFDYDGPINMNRGTVAGTAAAGRVASGLSTLTCTDVTFLFSGVVFTATFLFFPDSNSTINCYRCHFDFTGSTVNAAHLRIFDGNNDSSVINIKWCTFILPDSNVASASIICVDYKSGSPGASGVFQYNSVYGSLAPTNQSGWGVIVGEATATISHNLFTGLRYGLMESGNAYNSNSDSGYNVFHNNDNDFLTAVAQSTDISGDIATTDDVTLARRAGSKGKADIEKIDFRGF